jgi:thioredoxin-related protein
MKKFVILFLFTLATVTVQAQDGLKWHTDMAEAVKLSKKSKKPLFIFFTGSDWCGWCMRLQKEVLKTPEFEAWAKKNVILVELDFPKKNLQTDEVKKQNAELVQSFGVRGYPTVWFTDAVKGKDGKINFTPYGSIGYVAGGPAKWIEGAETILASKTKEKKK